MKGIKNAIRSGLHSTGSPSSSSQTLETYIEQANKIIRELTPCDPICDLSLVAPTLLRNEKKKNALSFLYLCQTDNSESVRRLRTEFVETANRKLKILTFKESVDGCLYLPKSTWTEGRNKLIEWAKQQPNYDYYMLIDDDIKFKVGNYDRVEYEISELMPFYYCPELEGYYKSYPAYEEISGDIDYKDIKYFITVWCDAIFSCFHRNVFFDEFVLPYEPMYDSTTWWISQAILFMKVASKYPNKTIVSKTCVVDNELHRDYPRNANIFTSLNHYFGKIPHFNLKTIPITNENCVIITTINPPNKQIEFYSKLTSYDLIIVADKKTDISAYSNTRCILLDLPTQKALAPDLYNCVPFNSYTRKMFGYVYAIANNYKLIYETDDDNMFKNEDLTYSFSNKQALASDPGFVNIYKNYTDQNIWPRGIPSTHESVSKIPNITPVDNLSIALYQGLVDKDPDVDAIYRISHMKGDVFFDKNYSTNIVLNKFSVCPFNSQNTFWVDKSIMYSMYLPVTVTFRYTDILRSFVSLFEIWKKGKNIAFTPASAIQERNEHDLEKDKESELPMYLTAEKVCDLLKDSFDKDIVGVYQVLLENGIVKPAELKCLNVWLKTIARY